jgi:hypothetical protein
MTTNPLTPDFAAVHVMWDFDLQTYRDLGLDLTELEDPNEGTLLPEMRRTAAQYVIAATESDESLAFTAGTELREAHLLVRRKMIAAVKAIQPALSDITHEHPAIKGYTERHPETLIDCEPARHTNIDGMLRSIHRVNLELVRPTDTAEDPTYTHRFPFHPVNWKTKPYSNYYETYRPEKVASQLAIARVGTYCRN